jgi:peptidyl-prolyl cis-trans isomerase D
MLNVLRENLKKRAWTKWLLLVVAGSMTLYLAAYFGGGGGGDAATEDANWAARIDGEPIPTQQFLDVARLIDQRYRQLFGDNYGDMRDQFRIGTQAIQQLLEDEVILRDARRLGLTVSNDELIERIRTTPGLTDASGNFVGKQQYETVVNRAYRGGVAAFESALASEMLIEKWTDLVSQSVTVSEADLEDLYRRQNEKTVIDYFVVASADQDVATTIGDADVEAWYRDHSEDYMRDEGRRIRSITVRRQPKLDEIEIGEDEIEAAYRASQAKYTHPEQRRARHILFRVAQDAPEEERQAARDKAADVLARLEAGEDFAELAKELSEDTFSGQRGGDLDWFGRGDMVGPFDAAVFGMAPGDPPVMVETQFGYHVLEVTDAREAGAIPLDDVRDEIVSELRLARADEMMAADAARIRDRITGPGDFDRVAQEEGLEVDTRFVNQKQGLTDIGASTEFRTTVLEMEPGEVSTPLRVSSGLAVVVVDELVPESVAPLEEVVNQVRTDLLNHRAREAALSTARNAFDLNESLTEVAEMVGEEVRDSGELAPGQSIPGTGGGAAELRRALFGETVAIGDSGVIEVPAGALVYEVTAHTGFDPAAFAAARESLRQQLMQQRRLSMRRSMVDRLSQEVDIVINDQVVRRIDGGA